MSKNTRDAIVVLVPFVALIAGCFTAENANSAEEHHDHTRFCHLKIVPASGVPEDAFVLQIDHDRWVQNAPRFAAEWNDAEAQSQQKPYDVGGLCDEGYWDEGQWMISLYEETPGATTTPLDERRDNHKFFFSMRANNETHHMQLDAEWYGYKEYPPEEQEATDEKKVIR